jgi:hypothetical protein
VVERNLKHPPTTVGGILAFCASFFAEQKRTVFATGIKFFPGQDGYIIPAHKEQ